MTLVGALWGGYLEKHPEYSASVHAALMEMYGAGNSARRKSILAI
jgi:hypothetical protein